ncbi:MAG: hypothetical protein ACI8Q6_004025 [Granulosicoccus sp.]|jgi:hypothetical protein
MDGAKRGFFIARCVADGIWLVPGCGLDQVAGNEEN